MLHFKPTASTLAAALAVAAVPSLAAAQILPGFDAESIPANDDGSADAAALGFEVNFFGQRFDEVFVNNNGNVTFDQPLSSFTPFDLTSTNTPIIAPFFADVDTRGAGSALVTFGQGEVGGRDAFGATYDGVGFFSSRADLLNAFQVVLIDRSDVGEGDFDFVFNYEQIQFETGNASGGNDGLGGSSARVGFSNGTGEPGTSFEQPGSAVNGAFLDGGPNSLADLETLLFEVRNGAVTPVDPTPPVAPPVDPTPPTNPNPIPTPSAALAGLALLGGVIGRRKR